MACDGVWDVMGNDEACFFLRKCIQDGGRDLGLILEQIEEDFHRNGIDGIGLLALSEGDLRHKLHLKKVGLRKRLWQRLSPLRLGYVAWGKKDLAAWLEHVDLKELPSDNRNTRTFFLHPFNILDCTP